MIQAKWKQGCGFFNKADAQKVTEEILTICEDLDSARPEDIVEKAKDESTELHKCFTWDNDEASRKYRLIEARNITRLLVVKENVVPKNRPEIRMFFKTSANEGYKPTQFIVRKEDEYNSLLERAWRELRAFKMKYAMLEELSDIFDLID